MKFCILIHSISCDLRMELVRREIEIGLTFEVAQNICHGTLYEREEL